MRFGIRALLRPAFLGAAGLAESVPQEYPIATIPQLGFVNATPVKAQGESNTEWILSGPHRSFGVQNYLEQRAAQKGIPLGEIVNGLLKQEIQIIESVK